MILLAYDGSEHARHAIATAGSLLSGRAVVAYVSPSEAQGLPAAAPDLAGSLAVPAPLPEADEQQEHARGILDEGCQLAADAGFDVQREVLHGTGARGIRETLLSAADERYISLIVVGQRGMGSPTAAVPGGVCDGLIRHSSHPVLVVPSPES